MLVRLRKSPLAMRTAILLVFGYLAGIIAPGTALAITGGPSQPEVSSFQPIGVSDMVDLFTGDFSYNIPLLDVGGYPLNLIYNAGPTSDQEASWVGLGWNINPGAITRNVRGLPDDFRGDQVVQEFNLRPNQTFGVSGGVGGEALGFKVKGLGAGKLSYSLGVNFNNYNGVGFEQTLGAAISSADKAKGGLTAGLGLKSNSDGLTITPSLSYEAKLKKIGKGDVNLEGSLGASVNSRAGLKALTFDVDAQNKNATVIGEAARKNNGSRTLTLSGENGGSSLTFASSSYVPQVTMPMVNTSVTFSGKIGGTFIGLSGSWDVSGYYSEQRLETNRRVNPAFGYLYSHSGRHFPRALLDFNREKDAAFTLRTKNLPLTNVTYDVYSVSGQGVGGMYRPFRSDLGVVFDPQSGSRSSGGSLGVEWQNGNAAHAGLDLTFNKVETRSGEWVFDNPAQAKLNFEGRDASDPLYEPVYFKQVGEKSLDSDLGLFQAVGQDQPVHVDLQSAPFLSMTVRSKEQLIDKQGQSIDLNAFSQPNRAVRRSQRQRRNQAITFLRADQVEQFGLSGYRSPRSAGKGHHIGEVTALRPDGVRYVYGLPAYNTFQKEVTFSVGNSEFEGSPSGFQCQDGLVSFAPGDDTVGNRRGIDHYFNSTATPPYAHSYLLTAVLSADYSDLTGDGPSCDDLGSYTRFDYVNTHGDPGQGAEAQPYQWRIPYQTGANFNEGLKSDQRDNKASYVYGTKDLWYLQKIETKTHVAVFTLSDRVDGFGVQGPQGGLESGAGSPAASSKPMKKLTRISLFAKPDLDVNGQAATPIKEVHFEYDYSLAQGVPNNCLPCQDPDGFVNQGGKLTLKRVFFTYGKSQKGRLSPYRFEYHPFKAAYGNKNYDRWGLYKPDAGCQQQLLSNADFPYVEQGDRAQADQFAAAWSLERIHLPSGGIIRIAYEADDYGYVQDRRAMQMFRISGIGREPSDSPAGSLPLMQGNQVNPILFFELQEELPLSEFSPRQVNALLARQYFQGIEDLYFKFLVNLTCSNPFDQQCSQRPNSGRNFEYISGYMEIEGFGVAPPVAGAFRHGWLRVRQVPRGDGTEKECTSNCVHPVSRAAWQFGRLNTPELVFNFKPPGGNDIEDILFALLDSSLVKNIVETAQGPNGVLKSKGYGMEVQPQKSWIRLLNPGKRKIGGGHRVRRIELSDEWDPQGLESDDLKFQYGQEYSYQIEEEFQLRPAGGAPKRINRSVSSGVAAYEPMLGGDENPFRRPVFLGDDKWLRVLVPDDTFFQEEPFGETFFPSPTVGYSRVTVRNLRRLKDPGQPESGQNPVVVKRHATGRVVHEFYTARDFPTRTDRTRLLARPKKSNPLIALLKLDFKDFMTASQGYTVIRNDMHGKQKAQWVYAQDQITAISGVEYLYKTRPEDSKRLSSRVLVIDREGTVKEEALGLDFDFVTDMRQQATVAENFVTQANFISFLLAIFPVFIPPIWPAANVETTRFRSSVSTKVIHQYGILERVVAHDLGSSLENVNLAYDGETGEVLLTRTINGFNDDIYSLTYPAHWGYEGMGPAYRNVDAAIRLNFNDGFASLSGAERFFTPGDELSLDNTSKAWVLTVEAAGIRVVNEKGEKMGIAGSRRVRVLRSGRRNQQTSPIGTLTSLVNPLLDDDGDGNPNRLAAGAGTRILNAGAVEFSDQWGAFCGGSASQECDPQCQQNDIGLVEFLNGIDRPLCEISPAQGDPDNVQPSPPILAFLEERFGPQPPLFFSTSCSVQTQEILGLFSAAANAFQPPSGLRAPPSDRCFLQLSTPDDRYFPVLAGFVPGAKLTFRDLQFVLDRGDPCFRGQIFDFTLQLDYSIEPCSPRSSVPCSATGILVRGSSCLPVALCGNAQKPFCEVEPGEQVNPYVLGMRGNWRAKRSLLYLTEREQSWVNERGNIRRDGFFVAFDPFWTPTGGGPWQPADPAATGWQFTSEVTQFSPFGFELENRDALGRYSTALYGYADTLPVAVASNARLKQVASDGFEDYEFDCPGCRRSHFELGDGNALITDQESHSGLRSLQIGPGQDLELQTELTMLQEGTTARDSSLFVLQHSDCIDRFSPDGGAPQDADYVLSAWVREDAGQQTLFDFNSARLEVLLNGTLLTPAGGFERSRIIDGWQQVEAVFRIPANSAGTFRLRLANSSQASKVFFDDLRIHPFDSSLKSFVYHPQSLRLMAELDERNYATFYEYDEEGALIRVKKETREGIKTIQSSRNSTIKVEPQ